MRARPIVIGIGILTALLASLGAAETRAESQQAVDKIVALNTDAVAAFGARDFEKAEKKPEKLAKAEEPRPAPPPPAAEKKKDDVQAREAEKKARAEREQLQADKQKLQAERDKLRAEKEKLQKELAEKDKQLADAAA